MSETNPSAIGTEGLGTSAGALLRAAREKRGVHIAALAAAMKVPQRKLEALEADRHDELPDMTFTRALAQSMCRALKIEQQAVLDRLPQAGDSPKLARMGSGINAPFRERPGRDEPSDWTWLRRPVVWGTVLVLLGAAALAFLPQAWLSSLGLGSVGLPGGPSTTSVADTKGVALPATPALPPSDAAASAPAAEPAASTPTSALPVMPPATPAAVLPALAGTAALQFKSSGDSWVEVQDARGQTLISRNVVAGESVGLDGAVPLRVTVGNASAMQVNFRGQAVDLSANTVGNVARLQLN